jgi:hypothetical protein
LWWPFWKWRPVEIFQCRESIRDIIIYPHIKFWWYWHKIWHSDRSALEEQFCIFKISRCLPF